MKRQILCEGIQHVMLTIKLKFIQLRVSFSLKDKTVFCFFILLGCKYVFSIYITVFVLNLINLFNAYLLLFLRILILFY